MMNFKDLGKARAERVVKEATEEAKKAVKEAKESAKEVKKLTTAVRRKRGRWYKGGEEAGASEVKANPTRIREAQSEDK